MFVFPLFFSLSLPHSLSLSTSLSFSFLPSLFNQMIFLSRRCYGGCMQWQSEEARSNLSVEALNGFPWLHISLNWFSPWRINHSTHRASFVHFFSKKTIEINSVAQVVERWTAEQKTLVHIPLKASLFSSNSPSYDSKICSCLGEL